MARFAIFHILSAVLAGSQLASSTPAVFPQSHSLDRRNSYQTHWPQSLDGLFFDQSWPDFDDATRRWSTYMAPSFDQVFLPENEEELSLGLKYMSSHNMTWLAQSGGHGYSITLHSIQNAVLINMERFNCTTVQDDGMVVVGSGVHFGDLVDIVGAAGRELTVGSCPCVGATGAMLGGGLGRLQGLHGLTSDALRKVRMVLWNGTIVEASDEVNQDLFWGVRGSGQNYGIVFESTYESWPATNDGLQYNADMVFNRDSVEKIVDIANNLTAAGLDEKLSMVIFFAQDASTSDLTIILNIVYAGPEEEGRKYTNLFSGFSLSLNETVMPWADLPEESVMGLLPAACVPGNRGNLYSVITETLPTQLWAEFTEDLEEFLQQYPLANASAVMIEVFPLQGIQALPDDYSAFPHRKQFTNHVETFGSYTDDSVADAVDDFFREWRDRFDANSGYDELYIYQNYGHGDEVLSALYGYEDWRHKRLTELKNAYDPHGFFNGYHAVPATLGGWS